MIKIDEKLNKIVVESYYETPQEVLDFKRDVDAADNVEDIDDLILKLSDGVAEDVVKRAFDFAKYNHEEVLESDQETILANVKKNVIMALDIYLEENDWNGDEAIVTEEAEKTEVTCDTEEDTEELKNINFLEEFNEVNGNPLPAHLVDAIEALDWTVHDYATDVELETRSPAGENLVVYATKENFVQDVIDYAYTFDADEHIEEMVMAKAGGLSGVPSIRELVNDADEIADMLQNLAAAVINAQNTFKNDTTYTESFTAVEDDDNFNILSRYIDVELPDILANLTKLIGYKDYSKYAIKRAVICVRDAYNKLSLAEDNLEDER